MFGYDRCSPAGDRSSTGKTCYSKCERSTQNSHHPYQCYTDERMEYKEDCGNWHVARAEKKVLEYTTDDKVLAFIAFFIEILTPVSSLSQVMRWTLHPGWQRDTLHLR